MRAYLRGSLGGLIGVVTLWMSACGSDGGRTIVILTGGTTGIGGASAVGGQGGAASGGDSTVAGASGSTNGGNGSGGESGSSTGGDGNAGTATTGGSSGSGGSDTAGTNNGGSAGSSGSTGNGGSAGSSGSAGTGGSGGVAPLCVGSISVNQTACTGPCRDGTCGIQFLGLRDCTCQGAGTANPNTYTCTPCDYTDNFGNPIIDPPGGPMELCPEGDSQMEDRLDCGNGVDIGYRCQSDGDANRMCACWDLVWDCGSKPSVWASICPGSIDSGITACSVGCNGGRCGIHNVGVRDCTCTSFVYTCGACNYDAAAGHPLIQAGALPTCPFGDVEMEDRLDCELEVGNEYRCQSSDDTNRLCACWNNVWDCASKPPLLLP